MLDRKLLLVGLGIAALFAITGYLSFRLGIDFTGGFVITIISEQPLTIPFSHTIKTSGQINIYEISMRIDRDLEQVISLRNDLVRCLREQANVSVCDTYVERLESISGIHVGNSSAIDYVDSVYETMVNRSISNLISQIPGKYSYSYNLITPTLSTELFTKILSIFLLGMVFVTIYIIYTFKTWFPTINILSGALIDSIITLGIVSLLGFDVDLSILVGLLVLFGYSLDTNVLLVSNYYLTRRIDSIDESMKTGISMIMSSLLVFIIIFLIGIILGISFLKNIGVVMIIGLIVDFFTSWGYNAYLIQKFGDRYG
ncbi:MAG: hypothetical protein QXH89_02910 [Candidatus Anstonellales archaeon]